MGEFFLPIDEALLVFFQDGRRNFLSESRVAEFLLHFDDFGLDFFEFFAEAVFLSGDVDEAFGGKVKFAHGGMDREGAFARLVFRDDFEFLGVEEKFEDGEVVGSEFVFALEDEADFLAGRNVGFAAEIATLGHKFVFRVDVIKVAIVEAVEIAGGGVERFGPGSVDDALAALVGGHVLGVTHAMPEFLGDEWEEWVEQSQGV